MNIGHYVCRGKMSWGKMYASLQTYVKTREKSVKPIKTR